MARGPVFHQQKQSSCVLRLNWNTVQWLSIFGINMTSCTSRRRYPSSVCLVIIIIIIIINIHTGQRLLTTHTQMHSPWPCADIHSLLCGYGFSTGPTESLSFCWLSDLLSLNNNKATHTFVFLDCWDHSLNISFGNKELEYIFIWLMIIVKVKVNFCIAYCYETIIFQYAIVTAYRLQARPAPTGPGLRLTVMPRPGLLFNGRHPHYPYNYMDHYSSTDPKGMEGWVGLVGWPICLQ